LAGIFTCASEEAGNAIAAVARRENAVFDFMISGFLCWLDEQEISSCSQRSQIVLS
jgi:hypothetical protein